MSCMMVGEGCGEWAWVGEADERRGGELRAGVDAARAGSGVGEWGVGDTFLVARFGRTVFWVPGGTGFRFPLGHWSIVVTSAST